MKAKSGRINDQEVVIPAAGLGTRLLPITKELPKEMLPVFFGRNPKICLMPMLQAVFEQLFDVGFRQFCFIVGRGKRAIEDHFTQDWEFVQHLKDRNKSELSAPLEQFYRKLTESTIGFVNQPEPKGFGDSVLRAKAFTGNENFVVHAGDDLILSKDNRHIKKLLKTFSELQSDATLLVEKMENPTSYGVVEGSPISDGIYRVTSIEEKPKQPSSRLAAIAVYAFRPKI